MALLDIETVTISEADRAANRVCPVTVKLTQDEHREVTEHTEGLGQARSEWIRGLILAELQRENDPSKVDPLLAEIVGVRLLLVNLFKPKGNGQEPLSKVGFELLLNEIKKVKRQVALDIQRDSRGDSK
jgi:hypothetical protein